MLQGVESHFRASQTQAWEVQPLHESRENQPFLQGWDWDGKDPGQEGFGLVCAGPDPHPREAESSGGSATGGTWSHKEPRGL